MIEEANRRLKLEGKPILFTHLTMKYCENHPKFEETVVAKIESPFLESALNYIVKEVEKEFNVKIPVADKSNYHLTVGVRPRLPKSVPETFSIKNILAYSRYKSINSAKVRGVA